VSVVFEMVIEWLQGGGGFLRRVNDHGHSFVAVSRLCAINPDRIRVVDGDHEDI
jgi:hypothetical protein